MVTKGGCKEDIDNSFFDRPRGTQAGFTPVHEPPPAALGEHPRRIRVAAVTRIATKAVDEVAASDPELPAQAHHDK
jgi:hypothetical protein